MANRYFTQFIASLAKTPVFLFGRVTFGAAGAPTLDAVNSKGIKSITRTGAGAYTIVLGSAVGTDIYPRLFTVDAVFLNATAPASPLVYIVSETVKTNGTINVQFDSTAGVATDPGSGEEVRFLITLTNSTAP